MAYHLSRWANLLPAESLDVVFVILGFFTLLLQVEGQDLTATESNNNKYIYVSAQGGLGACYI